ncbi:hypothetical protein [Xanthocytophaga flava]|uniref:hypothetical protein n=1 Tax=Xanthocytophaga flava TaxID=3048013 RepID=UPI0028D1A673|nr:hypothetical protein [Xanthocytophaga flavus]MDJ1472535.1 hypothetical protein [Xanthocytophaga flavus]
MQVLNKAGNNPTVKAAIKAMCAQKKQTDQQLIAIADEMYKDLTSIQINLFALDVLNKEDLSSCEGNCSLLAENLEKLTANNVNSWELIDEAKVLTNKPDRKRDIILLEKISTLHQKAPFNDVTFLARMLPIKTGNQESSAKRYLNADEVVTQFLWKHSRAIETGGGVATLKEELDNLGWFVDTHAQTSNVGAYLHETLQSSSKIKGGLYGMSLLQSGQPLAGLTVIGFEERLDENTDDAEESNLRTDIKFDNLFVETKNYSTVASLTSSSSFISQFEQYLKNVNSFDQIRYYFKQRNEITQTKVKEKFKEIYKKNNYAMFNLIWNNQELQNNLWPLTSRPPGFTKNIAQREFTSWVDKLDNRLFNFINVK